MPVEVTEYISVSKKLLDLGCRQPNGLTLLPINLETAQSAADLLEASETSTVRKLLIAAGIPIEDITDDGLLCVKNKDFSWVSPTIFVSAALYSQNPALVSLALNVVGNYATEFFRGIAGRPVVKLNIVAERSRDKVCKRIEYEGPPQGIAELKAAILRIFDE